MRCLIGIIVLCAISSCRVNGKLTWDIIQKIETWEDDFESQINKKVVYVFSEVEHLVKHVEGMESYMEDELKHSLMEVKRGMEELLEPALEEFGDLTKRSILDTLASLTKNSGSLGTILKIMDVFGKVGKFVDDVKKFAPKIHDALKGSINAIKSGINSVVSSLASNFESGGNSEAKTSKTTRKTSKKSRSILDTLSSLTKGSSGLSTILKIMDVFGKVGKFVDDVKKFAPKVHDALSGSVNDIKSGISSIVSALAHEFESGGNSDTKTSKTTRSILDTLSSLTKGSGSLSTILKIMDVFGKVGKFIDDVKKFAPKVHDALSGSVNDIKSGISSVVSSLAHAFESGGNSETKTSKTTRSILDTLSSLTKGSGSLSTILKIMDVFGKVGKFIDDVKKFAPKVHDALSGSVDDIKSGISSVVSSLAHAFESGGNSDTKTSKTTRSILDTLSSLTKGSGSLSTILKIMDVFGKVGKFVDDVKKFAPKVHDALSGSVKDIKSGISSIVSSLAHAFESGGNSETKTSKTTRSILDTLSSLTKGSGSLSTILKIMDVFGKVGKFIDDVKKFAPKVHDALSGSVNDIKSGISSVVSTLAHAFESSGNSETKTSKTTRSILDTLSSLTKGSGSLSTILKIMDVFGKVGKFIDDVKKFAPKVHDALSGSVDDIKSGISSVVSSLAHAFESSGNSDAKTSKTSRSILDILSKDSGSLSTIVKIMDVFGKVGKFVDDIKKFAPKVHDALKGSVDDIKNGISSIVSSLAQAFESGGNAKATRGFILVDKPDTNCGGKLFPQDMED